MKWLIGSLSVVAGSMGVAVIWMSFLRGGFPLMLGAITLCIFLLGFLIWLQGYAVKNNLP